jgi:hypothetical protein
MNTKTSQLNDYTKIKVLYDDGTSRQTTVAELIAFFSDETKAWQHNFWATLERDSVAFTAFAKYSII